MCICVYTPLALKCYNNNPDRVQGEKPDNCSEKTVPFWNDSVVQCCI